MNFLDWLVLTISASIIGTAFYWLLILGSSDRTSPPPPATIKRERQYENLLDNFNRKVVPFKRERKALS